jgi:hypothetical protein
MSKNLEHDTFEFPRFGKETNDGIETMILDETLSAVELRVSLPVRKGQHCIC